MITVLLVPSPNVIKIPIVHNKYESYEGAKGFNGTKKKVSQRSGPQPDFSEAISILHFQSKI